MIARSWDGLTTAEQADAYADYIRRTGVKDLVATTGNRGVYVLRRREGDVARFRVLSLWDSMDGIRRFAGDEPERARYYPEDERFLEALDPHVSHFEVVAQGGRERGSRGGRRAGSRARDAGPRQQLARADAPRAAGRRCRRRPRRRVPSPGAHTIWELVLHVTAWTDVFRRRLEGAAVEEPEAGDFPAPGPAHGERSWAEATQALFESHAALTACVSRLSDAELAAGDPGPAVRQALPGAGGDPPHRLPQRPDRPAAKGRGRGLAPAAQRGERLLGLLRHRALRELLHDHLEGGDALLLPARGDVGAAQHEQQPRLLVRRRGRASSASFTRRSASAKSRVTCARIASSMRASRRSSMLAPASCATARAQQRPAPPRSTPGRRGAGPGRAAAAASSGSASSAALPGHHPVAPRGAPRRACAGTGPGPGSRSRGTAGGPAARGTGSSAATPHAVLRAHTSSSRREPSVLTLTATNSWARRITAGSA